MSDAEVTLRSVNGDRAAFVPLVARSQTNRKPSSTRT